MLRVEEQLSDSEPGAANVNRRLLCLAVVVSSAKGAMKSFAWLRVAKGCKREAWMATAKQQPTSAQRVGSGQDRWVDETRESCDGRVCARARRWAKRKRCFS